MEKCGATARQSHNKNWPRIDFGVVDTPGKQQLTTNGVDGRKRKRIPVRKAIQQGVLRAVKVVKRGHAKPRGQKLEKGLAFLLQSTTSQCSARPPLADNRPRNPIYSPSCLLFVGCCLNAPQYPAGSSFYHLMHALVFLIVGNPRRPKTSKRDSHAPPAPATS